MLSPKNQAVDTWTLLQISQIQPNTAYVGDITGLMPALTTIHYPQDIV
jgi:hypothetical protein